jgi:uncharacterized protein
MNYAIIIMAKVPEAGKVKTRLQPFLTPAQSAELAECLLQDTINKAKSFRNKLIIAYSPPEKSNFFERFDDLNLVVQIGENLGERMFNAFDFTFASDLDSVVMIGTDSPTFPPEFIEKAFEYLQQNEAVLGATEDGGFYLIGLRKSDKRIFENVEWSSAKTFEQTKNNLLKIGFDLAELPVWYDIDNSADLLRLHDEFSQSETAQKTAPETFRWLKAFLPETEIPPKRGR